MTDLQVLANDGVITVVATSNGQTDFDFDFLLYDEVDVKVTFKPGTVDEDDLVLGVSFSVAGTEQENGGTITLIGQTVLIGDEVLIYRDTIIKRLADYQVSGDFRAETINRELDEMTTIDQETKRETTRSVKVPYGSAVPVLTPGAEGTVPQYAANGNLVEGPSATEIENAQGYAVAAAASADAAEEAALDANGTKPVADRTALKALDTSSITAAYLQEGKRGGLFDWDAAVPIATHQADTREGIYVAPNSGAIGAWSRRRRDHIYVNSFGVVAGGDIGPAFQAALNFALTEDLRLILPHGRFTSSQKISVTTPKNIWLLGPGSRHLHIDFDNTNGGIELTGAWNPAAGQDHQFFGAKGFEVRTNQAGLHVGVAFLQKYVPSSPFRTWEMSDLQAAATNINDPTHHFSKAYHVEHGWNGLAENCIARNGNSVYSGDAILIDGHSIACEIHSCKVTNFDKGVTHAPTYHTGLAGTPTGAFVYSELVTQAVSGATGHVSLSGGYGASTVALLDVTGTFDTTNIVTGATSGATMTPTVVAIEPQASEGTQVRGGEYIQNNRGIDIDMPASVIAKAVGMFISNVHLANIEYNIYGRHADQVVLNGGVYYPAGNTTHDINARHCSRWSETGVIHTFGGGHTGTTALVIADGSDWNVTGNSYQEKTLGWNIGPNVTGSTFVGNQFSGNSTNIVNAGPVYPAAGFNTFANNNDGSGAFGVNIGERSKFLDVERTDRRKLANLYDNNAAAPLETLLAIRTKSAGSTGVAFVNFENADGANSAFQVRHDGSVFSDGGTAMGTPADYAEMFEWADGNPDNEDRIGLPVVMIDDKIAVATCSGDDVFGVVSGNPTVLGDAAWGNWTGAHEHDAYNRPVLNADGSRKPGAKYDPTRKYVPRADRQEWAAIGLLGKLRVKAGAPTNPRWVKMRGVVVGVEEWLVR